MENPGTVDEEEEKKEARTTAMRWTPPAKENEDSDDERETAGTGMLDYIQLLFGDFYTAIWMKNDK